MADYDSILKEEKKYEDPEPIIKPEQVKEFPWLLIDIMLLTILIIISYFIYYKVILSPEKEFLNDLKVLTTKYQKIFEPLELQNLTKEKYNLVGIMQIDETEQYYIDFNKKDQKINLNLSIEENSLNYFLTANKEYLKLPSYENAYYQLSSTNKLTELNKIYQYIINELSKKDFIQKFYLNGANPIIETNLVLKDKDIKQIIDTNNNYDIICTFKNHAITNKIISTKITVNNKTTDNRYVILFEDDKLTYKDDNHNFKFNLVEKNNDFILRIYQNDNLYSVLEGKDTNKYYQYNYQIIDQIYNIKLNTKKTSNIYTYQLASIIEQDKVIKKSTMNIKLKYNNNPNEKDVDISNSRRYNDLTKEEQSKYQQSLNNVIDSLRQFINKHKYSINQIND